MNDPLVSIIIPTKNSEETLARCLRSIRDQTYKNIEVIIADGFSNDNTMKVANRYGAKVMQEICNKPEARNIGIFNAKGKYILLLDSDMALQAKVIEESVEKFEKENCDTIFIDEEYEDNTFWNRCRNLEKTAYRKNALIEAPRFFKEDIFKKILFDEKNEGPDEYDFYLSAKKFDPREERINHKIVLLESPFNFKKKFHHGKFFLYYRCKHKKEENSLKEINLRYRTKILFGSFKLSPIWGMGLLFLKFLDYLFFKTGLFISYFDRKTLRLAFSLKEEFNEVAETYEKKMFGNSIGCKFVDAVEKEAVLALLKKINLKNNAKILDVGAGNGRFSREFLRLGFDVTALDISPNMCKHLRNNVRNLRRIINEDIAKIRPLNENFDLIFSFRSFKYTRNKKRALCNIKTLLKEKGYLVVEMPNLLNPFYFFPYVLAPFLIHFSGKENIRYLIVADFITKNSFTEELKMAGLQVKKMEPLFFFPHCIYAKVENRKYLKVIYGLDTALSKFFPRSLIFVAKNE